VISHTQNITVYYQYVSKKIIIYKIYLFLAIVGRVSSSIVVSIRKYVVSEYTLREHVHWGNSRNSRVTAG